MVSNLERNHAQKSDTMKPSVSLVFMSAGGGAVDSTLGCILVHFQAKMRHFWLKVLFLTEIAEFQAKQKSLITFKSS